MTDTISKAAKAKAEELLAEGIGAGVVDAVTALTALARVLQEHSDKAREVKLQGMYHGWREGDPAYDTLQSMILPDDEPEPLDEIGHDLFQRIAHGDSEHREWLKRELSRNLRIVAAGYEIRRKDG